MLYNIINPSQDKIDSIINLCAAHAAFEECDYDKKNKAEQLAKDIFGENPKLFCLVAETNGKYIGYITWMKQYSTWDAQEYLYMDCLYLEDAYRGIGIGEALVNRMKEYGRAENIDLVQWQTPHFNERAIKFYKRIGATSKSKERFYLTIKSLN